MDNLLTTQQAIAEELDVPVGEITTLLACRRALDAQEQLKAGTARWFDEQPARWAQYARIDGRIVAWLCGHVPPDLLQEAAGKAADPLDDWELWRVGDVDLP